MRKIFTNKADKELILTGDDHKHLSVVLRAKVNDEVLVSIGDGFDYIYTVQSFSKTETNLILKDKRVNKSEPNIDLTIFTAILKGDKNDYVVRTCTELGVSKVVPLLTKFIQVKKESYKIDRMKKIALEASKQCGRGSVPNIENPIDIKALSDMIDNYDFVVFPYEKASGLDINSLLLDMSAKVESPKYKSLSDKKVSIAVIVGSEGGFSQDEADMLVGNGAKAVTLGSRILRADTACTAVCSLVMCYMGEMK